MSWSASPTVTKCSFTSIEPRNLHIIRYSSLPNYTRPHEYSEIGFDKYIWDKYKHRPKMSKELHVNWCWRKKAMDWIDVDEKESCDGKSFLIDGSALSSSMCVLRHIVLGIHHRDTQQMEQQFKSQHKPHFIPLCVFYSPAKITATRITIIIIIVHINPPSTCHRPIPSSFIQDMSWNCLRGIPNPCHGGGGLARVGTFQRHWWYIIIYAAL